MRCTIKFKGVCNVKYMSFGLIGEPLTKVQRTDSGSVAGSYALAYEYGDADHPTAPSQIGHERYTYNAAGERIVKSHGYLEGVYVNGAPQGLTFHETEDYTIYPAPILSVTRQRFTKHYFIGDRRIASKIGAGIFQNAYGHGANVVTAGQKDYQMRMMQIEKQREDYYRKLGTPPGVPTMKGATADPDNTGYGYNTIIGELGDHSVPEGWVQRPKFNDKGDVPGPPIQWQKPEDPDNAQPGYGYVPADTTNTEEIFFYHSDHLGSTSYITDAKANITQFDAYLPYGELLVDEHSSSEDMPYKFNGKEFDEETGLYYYGARYMNPRTSLWYGVDGLKENYPELGSYTYCADNPVKFVDPDGNIALIDNAIGALIGACLEITTQMVANLVVGNSITDINWGKVAVATIEGAITSGASNTVRFVTKISVAAANSTMDNYDKGFIEVVKGTAVNLAAGAVGSKASKLAKGVGNKATQKISNKMISSKTSLTKTVKKITKVNNKRAKTIATNIQKAQKAVAKEVKQSPQTAVDRTVSNVIESQDQSNNTNKKDKR